MQVQKYVGIYEYINDSKRHQPQKIVQTLFRGLWHETTMASPCSNPLTGEIATKAASKYDNNGKENGNYYVSIGVVMVKEMETIIYTWKPVCKCTLAGWL